MNDKYRFILAMLVFIATTLLTYQGVIDQATYASVVSLILGYYFGEMYGKERMLKQAYRLKLPEGKRIEREYKGMVVRFAILMISFGTALIWEKMITEGAVVTVPPPVDHGLYGLFLVFIGVVMLTKIGKKYIWE